MTWAVVPISKTFRTGLCLCALLVGLCVCLWAWRWRDEQYHVLACPKETSLRSLQASAVAFASLQGAGFLAVPLRVQCVSDVNGSEVIVYHLDGHDDSTCQREPVECCATVQIHKSGWIQILGEREPAVGADPATMVLERAVVAAVVFASTLPGEGYDQYRVCPKEYPDGSVTVFFEELPAIYYGGDFFVTVKDDVIWLGGGF